MSGDLYLFDFGGGEDAEQWRAKRAAALKRIYDRYLERLITEVGLEQPTAARVMVSLFRHSRRKDGEECGCSCHPSLSETHDGGFDCSCTWDDERREQNKLKWDELFSGPEAEERRRASEDEENKIKSWIAQQPGVEAERTTFACPEQWEGSVDGHSFYFRERRGTWRIEIDLAPSGHFANRVVEAKDGEWVTEPVELEDGEVIAEGIEGELGATAIHHIDFIVRKIRDHLWGLTCDHFGALFFCPKCGQRMLDPT